MALAVVEDFTVASELGDLCWMRRCMKNGAKVYNRNTQGLTALHMVCREWHYECLKYLLDHCNVDINVAAERNGETPLHMAVKKATPSRPTTQCLQVLKILLERGADCNKQCFKGRTPLHFVSSLGNVTLVKLLINSGADIQVEDVEGMTALCLAELGAHHEVSRLLRSLHWAADKDQQTNRVLLQTAMKQEQMEIAAEYQQRSKHYGAVKAYESWLDKKRFSGTPQHEPGRCQYRKEQKLKSSSHCTRVCDSCHKSVTSRTSSASTVPHVRPMIISQEQKRKNVDHIGSPASIYPYTNYPNKKRCNLPKEKPKVPIDIKKNGKTSRSSSESSTKVSRCSSEETGLRDGKSLEQLGQDSSFECIEEPFSNEDCELDNNTELMFHEVEQTSLKGLSGSLYIQELLGADAKTQDSTEGHLSVSQINHRHSTYRGKLMRRVSLGAIPEGRIVEDYRIGQQDMLATDFMAWQAVLASQRQCQSAPPSPIGSARSREYPSTSNDDDDDEFLEDFAVQSEGSNDSDDEDINRPDTPLPSMAYGEPLSPSPVSVTPINSVCNLSSPSSHSLSGMASPEPSPPNHAPQAVWGIEKLDPSIIVPSVSLSNVELCISGDRIAPAQRTSTSSKLGSERRVETKSQVFPGHSPSPVSMLTTRQTKSASSLKYNVTSSIKPRILLKPTVMQFGGGLISPENSPNKMCIYAPPVNKSPSFKTR